MALTTGKAWERASVYGISCRGSYQPRRKKKIGRREHATRRKTLLRERTKWEMMLGRWFDALGVAYKAQAPIGPYFADFLLLRSRTVIELDGLEHTEPLKRRKDRKRTEHLQSLGFRVMRFMNSEIRPETRATVIKRIAAACRYPR